MARRRPRSSMVRGLSRLSWRGVRPCQRLRAVRRSTLPVPMAGSAALSLDLPGRPADVRIAPGALARTTVIGDLTRIEATLVPGAPADALLVVARNQCAVGAARGAHAVRHEDDAERRRSRRSDDRAGRRDRRARRARSDRGAGAGRLRGNRRVWFGVGNERRPIRGCWCSRCSVRPIDGTSFS